MRKPLLMCCLIIFTGRSYASNPRLAKSSREDRAGWVYVHLSGSPRDIGYQHGYLLAPEIDDSLKMFAYFVKRSFGKDWAFYRASAKKVFWPKLEPEYRQEIIGIAEGLNARGKKYDPIDITALNGWMELSWYYIPMLAEMKRSHAGDNQARECCSAFIATGSYTKDGKIVMAHNAWVDYIVGERWNIVADIVPAKGHRILMDTYPGFIHSGDDFVVNDAGILITETTISGFKGFNEKGEPEFQRARRAAQYANSINDFVKIMVTRNNGGYANDWLVGDTKTNEIARLELGLKHHRVWRTKDGILVGSNFPVDEKVAAEETNYDLNDNQLSANARHMRWDEAGAKYKGKLDLEIAKKLMGDHYDQANLCIAASCRSLCGHIDLDKVGIPEGGWGDYYPAGAVQGKVVTSDLATQMKFWARMGHPCGGDFKAAAFFKQHPQYKWQGVYLKDMKAGPWALFGIKK